MVAALRYSERHPLRAEATSRAVTALQAHFGRATASDMVTLAPSLLARSPERMIAHFEGLTAVLGAGRAFALEVLRRAPDLLQHKPELVGAKLEALQAMFAVPRGAVLRLVRKAPMLLKCQTAKLRPHLDFLAAAGGLDAARCFRVYLSWPVLATTTLELVKQRYLGLQALLGASPDEMRRIVRVWPNMLGRDPLQLEANIATLAERVGVSKEAMVGMVRREPGLLSWSTSTLVHRVVGVSQVLKLPPELSLTLLTYHRPLLSNVDTLPRKLEVLQRVLGLPGAPPPPPPPPSPPPARSGPPLPQRARLTPRDAARRRRGAGAEAELYPLVHRHLTMLRFPVAAVEGKLACVAALSRLHAPWAAEWAAANVPTRVRAIQAGWSCHWRLVFLLQSGQQGSCLLGTALRLNHARFAQLYPGFKPWLNRYNEAVTAQDVPVLASVAAAAAAAAAPPSGGRGRGRSRGAAGAELLQPLEGPAIFTPVLLDASLGKALHSGSLYVRHKAAALSNQAGAAGVSGPEQLGADGAGGSGESSSSSSSSSSSRSSSSRGSGRGGADSGAGAAAAAPALAELPSPARRLAAWLGIDEPAAAQLLAQPRMARLSWAAWSGRLAAATGLLEALGHCPPREPLDAPAGSSGAAVAAAALPELAPQPSSPLLLRGGRAFASQRRHTLNRSQRAGEPAPPPAPGERALGPAQQALEAALASRQSQAVAGVAVACELAPFAPALCPPPQPRPPPAVVELVRAAPHVFVRASFEANARALAALAGASAHLRRELAALAPRELAALLGCPSPRLRFLQYLVHTGQPPPWAVGLRQLLLSTKWYGRLGALPGGQRQQFAAAYPGFADWEAAMARL
ncbi:hypothetical protein HT031_001498 [Scenedesmus sp. PABB004]|nr:hypothetical protein HT031_001498 [Scenedesmus sp. PABB004]